jgi:hypothetical protein
LLRKVVKEGNGRGKLWRMLTESRLSLGLAIDVEYDVVTDVEFEQVDHEFDLELTVNRKSISISN